MPLTCLFVDDYAMKTDLDSLTVVALLRRHKFDFDVTMKIIVSVQKRRDPFAGIVLAGKRLAGVAGLVLCCPEQRF